MTKYKNEFKVAQGTKETFKRECERLAELGYVWLGNMEVLAFKEDVMFYQLFSKSTLIEEKK
jgi:hypothetical protein